MLRAIDRRTHNQYAVQASFHGIQVPLRHNTEQLTSEVDAKFDQAEQDLIDAEFSKTKDRMRMKRHG